MLNNVSTSVKETIGVKYEIISIDNSTGKYSICQAYNMGAAKSKFEVLCFMHEDLLFHTPDWGKAVIGHFHDVTIGLIGVVGNNFKSKSNSGWWGGSGIPPEFFRWHYIQGRANNKKPEHLYLNPQHEDISDVVSVDGMWLCTRKETWQNNKFDEHHFKSFHFYDLDFSLQIKQTLRVCIIYDVLIEHLSYGTINKSWIESSLIFHEKWKSSLPLCTIPITSKQLQMFELFTANNFLRRLKEFHYNKAVIIKFYIQYLSIYTFHDYLYYLKKAITGPFSSK